MRKILIYKYIGKVLMTYSILLFIPAIVAVIYKESPFSFIVTGLLSLTIGLILNLIKKSNGNLYARDGFTIVSLSWIIISIISALPLMMDCKLSFFDAFFEAVSGLTTTGATIFKNVEMLDHSVLFWRSLMHFIGGMGVLAFVMASVPLAKNDKSMHLLKAEMPGPNVSKLVPSLKKTLQYLYIIYIFLTLVEIGLLLYFKMPLFDSLLIAMGTAGTGGFSLLNSSVASYTVGAKIVVTIFMLLFGVNFNVYFLIVMKDIKSAIKSEELRVYISIYALSVLAIFLNTMHMFPDKGQALLEAAFHISSIFTSTGYSIGNINIYPTNAQIICLALMIISACAGSTCGGFKVARLILCFKSIKRDILKLIHPQSVKTIYFEGKPVDEDTIKSTKSFLLLYIIILIFIIFIVSFDNMPLETCINAVFCTFGNVGLCFGISSFAMFSNLSKIVLSIGMLLGRLEIFPMVILLTNIKQK